MRILAVGLEANGIPVIRDCLVHRGVPDPFGLHQQDAEVIVGHPTFGVLPDRFAVQLSRVDVQCALPPGQHAQNHQYHQA